MPNVFDELNEKINKLPKEKQSVARTLLVNLIESDDDKLILNLSKFLKYLKG